MYEYAAGISDWRAHNLEVEGSEADAPTAGRLAHDDVVTCRLEDQVGKLVERVRGSRYRFALVTTPGGVVLGRLRGSALDCDPTLTVEEVMEPGPWTVRADKPAAAIAKRLADKELKTAIVTTPEGILIGVARRSELEQAE